MSQIHDAQRNNDDRGQYHHSKFVNKQKVVALGKNTALKHSEQKSIANVQNLSANYNNKFTIARYNDYELISSLPKIQEHFSCSIGKCSTFS